MEQNKKTLVLGASTNPGRYSYLAINRLVSNKIPVCGIGKTIGEVAGVNIETEKVIFDDVHTITLYLNPTHQKEYYDYILTIHPKRVIFNPGTENYELYDLLRSHNIQIEEACTLVMLSTSQY